MANIGFTELLVILAIALLLFGNRLPNVGKALGEGIRNFKKGLDGSEDESKNAQQTASQQAVSQPQAVNARARAGWEEPLSQHPLLSRVLCVAKKHSLFNGRSRTQCPFCFLVQPQAMTPNRSQTTFGR